MRPAVFIAVCLLAIAPSIDGFAQSTRDGDSPLAPRFVELGPPRPTPANEALERLREMARVQVRQVDEDRAEEIFHDIGGALAALGDAETAWTLAQALAPEAGMLDALALRHLSPQDAMRLLPTAVLLPEDRCRAGQRIADKLRDQRQFGFLPYVASTSGCADLIDTDPPPPEIVSVEPPPSSSPALSYKPPRTPPALDWVRHWAETMTCTPPAAECVGWYAHMLGGNVLLAERAGDGPEALELLSAVPERYLRLAATLEVLAGKLPASRWNSYLALALSDLRNAQEIDRRWVFYRSQPLVQHCLERTPERTRTFEFVTEKLGFSHSSQSWCFESLEFVALRAALTGEVKNVEGIAYAYRRLAAAPVADDERGKEHLHGAHALLRIGVLFYAAGHPKVAEDVVRRALELMGTGYLPVMMVPWLVLWGDPVHVRQIADLQRRGRHSNDTWRIFRERWAAGAVLKMDLPELQRAIAGAEHADEAIGALAYGIALGSAVSTARSESIAAYALAMFREAGNAQSPKAGAELAHALNLYGAFHEARQVAQLSLRGAIRSTLEPSEWFRAMGGLILALRAWDVPPDLHALLSEAATADEQARMVGLVVRFLAAERRFEDLKHVDVILNRADASNRLVAEAWRDVAIIYAREGDLLRAFDALLAMGPERRTIYDAKFSEIVSVWRRAHQRER